MSMLSSFIQSEVMVLRAELCPIPRDSVATSRGFRTRNVTFYVTSTPVNGQL
jgi:hypothetical protein